MMLIFVDEISSRVVYTFDLLFKDRGVSYELTNDPFTFEQSNQPKWVYALRPFEREYVTINPSELLFEESVKKHRIEKSLWEGHEVISFQGVPDIIASVFYTVSLYDEYLIDNFDIHGRIAAKDKLVVRYGWHRTLIVERWINHLIDFLQQQLDLTISVNKIPFSCTPTFDIDNTFAYLHKVGVRKWLSVAKDISKFDQSRLKERKEVTTHKQKDPYDTFDVILSLKETGFSPLVFWLLGDLTEYDRNLSYTNKHHIELISKIAEHLKVGLHPSYKSNDVLGQLAIEKNRLERIIKQKVTHSRQHFLRMQLPYTYAHLIKNGFEHDYTLGFFDEVGFRAGMVRPFNWFNLKENCATSLQLHPFAYMDVSLRQYLKLSPEAACDLIKTLLVEVHSYGGDFISLWHNETIGDYGMWKGWKDVLMFTLNEARNVINE